MWEVKTEQAFGSRWKTTMVLLPDKEPWKKNPKCAKELVQATIGAGGFVLDDIIVNAEMNEISLTIRPTKRKQYRCDICHRKAVRYNKGRGRRCWRCLEWVHRKHILRYCQDLCVKNLCQALAQKSDHLTENQQTLLQFLTKAPLKLYRIYLLKLLSQGHLLRQALLLFINLPLDNIAVL